MLLTIVFAGLFGTLVGSFANVVALRWDGDRGLTLGGRSHCPYCHRQLTARELVPIASFLIQSGRCRSCGAKLSARYVVVELVSALVWALVVWRYGLNLEIVFLLPLASILLITLLVDVASFLLPDVLTVLAAGLSLVAQPFLGASVVLQPSAIWFSHWAGAVIALALIGGLYVITQGKGMGLGDVKLAPVLGLTLGGPLTLVYLFTAFLSGAIIGVGLIVSGRASMKTAVPFGPFLIWGWFVALIWGPQIVAWYTELI